MITYTCSLDIKHKTDVCVVGCGPAGIAAALSAARNGKRVLVLEASAMAGGMSTAAYVPVLMSYSDGVRTLCGGIGQEIIERAQSTGAMRCSAIFAEKLKCLYEELLTSETNITLSYGTLLTDVITRDSMVRYVVCVAKSGMFAVEADMFIDATGDGDLAARAGGAWNIGDDEGKMMPGTLCSLWAGVDWDAYRAGGAFSHNDDGMLAILKQAYEDGVVSVDDYHHTGMVRTNDVLVTGNFSHCFGVNPLDELSMTRALIENRRLLQEYERMYQRYVKGFEHASLAASGSVMGIRESRRIIGDYVLTSEDYDSRASFEDEIGRYNFSIDIHPSVPGAAALAEHKKIFKGRHYGRGESYGIPYRILCPKGFDNLLTAGRCVSTDRPMMASLRVIPACWITGMAAGTAAAMAQDARCSTHTLDILALQARLASQGAYLPNYKA